MIALEELPTTDSPNGRKVRRAELRRMAAEALQDDTNGRSRHVRIHP